MPITVLLADDHAVVRDGLRALLEMHADIRVVASVGNGKHALAEALRLRPDVAVLDLAMPELNGMEAAERMVAQCPQTRIVILSIHATPEHIYQALQAGALGYLLKESAGEEVATAVRAAYAGRRYLSQRITDNTADHWILQQAEASDRSPLESLSRRERQVLQLVAEGKSSIEIADLLSLSPRTIETYRARMMQKLNLKDLASVVKFAIQHGLTPLQ